MNVIECKELTRSHGSIKALDNLSLTIKENKITGLIGRNGAGKTTLLKVLAGYWQETSGDVKVFAERPYDNLVVSANTILIDDKMNYPTSLTLTEILDQANHFYEKWDMDFAKRLFDYFSFDKRQIHSNLSKGNKSTFNVIIGLASRCALTMFDEPTTGMDAAARKDFYRALLKDYLAYPRTMIISSHHLDEIEDLIEDVLLIKDGRKFLHMPIDELKEFAIGLTGTTEKVNKYTSGTEVLYRKRIGVDSLYVAVNNNYSKDELDEVRRAGIEISSVAPSDICVYLTNTKKGGIDDVFNKNEHSL